MPRFYSTITWVSHYSLATQKWRQASLQELRDTALLFKLSAITAEELWHSNSSISRVLKYPELKARATDIQRKSQIDTAQWRVFESGVVEVISPQHPKLSILRPRKLLRPKSQTSYLLTNFKSLCYSKEWWRMVLKCLKAVLSSHMYRSDRVIILEYSCCTYYSLGTSTPT